MARHAVQQHLAQEEINEIGVLVQASSSSNNDTLKSPL
jgi:hypothetical protein